MNETITSADAPDIFDVPMAIEWVQDVLESIANEVGESILQLVEEYGEAVNEVRDAERRTGVSARDSFWSSHPVLSSEQS